MSDGDAEDKLYIYLGLDGHDACFLKPTSQTKYYDGLPELASSLIVYALGQVPGFSEPKPIIDASASMWRILKDALVDILAKEPWRTKQPMPSDFDVRLRRALKATNMLAADDKATRLRVIGSI